MSPELHQAPSPRPGARLVNGGVWFGIVSRPADRVWLMLFDAPADDRPSREIELHPASDRQGELWSRFVPGTGPGQLYAWRMESSDGRLKPDQWLQDPCASAVVGRPRWGEASGWIPGQPPRNGALFPKSAVLEDDFDWGADRPPRIPWAETVIYEAHLRGYTAHPSSGVRFPGTYRGFLEKIPYLKELGITAVEFLPITEFDEMEFWLENKSRRRLRNFWGYSPLAFFAPNARYASVPAIAAAVREFQELVRALHAAGMEVILDVVFNHTAELDESGPIWSFKGLDPEAYYLYEAQGRLADFTGCGNTFNANHPIAADLIVQCLQAWVTRFRVDGFRFDLASALTRGPDGAPLARPPLIDRIAEDPILRDVKLIAEPWDAAGLYQVGSFPHLRFAEWNGRFRDDVRRFWNGEAGRLGLFATRLCGSSDLYRRPGSSPLRSVHFVTSHDGFTLSDLVSYLQRHNEANGENNRDGESANFSVNHGLEGPSPDPHIQAARLRHVKNLLASLFLSRGVPMLLAGDEFGRTQKGNNNPYAQDNDISWVDWTLPEKHRDLLDFVRKLIAFRRAFPALRAGRFFEGDLHDGARPDIEWRGPDGSPPDWEQGFAVACRLDGAPERTGRAVSPPLFLAFNAGAKPARFPLPTEAGEKWILAWSTQENAPLLGEEIPGWIEIAESSVVALTGIAGDAE
ncbi:MAG: glycogen debranching protein GlgX [Kiritimatiellia bacterium]|nr:glycogen debranching protein GlgX [Kiritimatiellia bacterium]